MPYNVIPEDGQLVIWSIQMLGGLRLSYRQQPVTSLNTNRLQALFAYLAASGREPNGAGHHCAGIGRHYKLFACPVGRFPLLRCWWS